MIRSLRPSSRPRRLRSAQALAAAVADQRRAVLQMDVGHGEDFRRRVHQDGHVLRLRDRRHHLDRKRAVVGVRAGEHVDHRGARPERRFELLHRLDFDDLDADRPHRGVVDVARVLRDDRFILGEALEIRDADVQVGIAAGHAGRGGVRQARRAAVRHEPELGAGQLAEALADRVGQLVELDVVPRGRVDRRPHFRQHRRSADDRERSPCVDQRTDANRLIDVRARASGPRRAGRGRRAMLSRRAFGLATALAAASATPGNKAGSASRVPISPPRRNSSRRLISLSLITSSKGRADRWPVPVITTITPRIVAPITSGLLRPSYLTLEASGTSPSARRPSPAARTD